MRIALPLSLATFLFAAPVFATQPPDQSDQGTAPATRSTRAGAARQATPAHTNAPRQVNTPRQSNTPRQASAQQPARKATATRTIHTAQSAGHGYGHGIEASHPGLATAEPESESTAPQIVNFPAPAQGGLPLIIEGTPAIETVAGYCGHMSMPAVALREVSRGFSRSHSGIDLMAPHGSPIRAAAAGSVIYAGWYFAYGNIVDIRHADGVVTRYAHMSAFAPGLAAGTPVQAGEEIGKVGATGHAHGAHVHFEVRLGGRAVDPKPYLALASCNPTAPREEILEAYADDRPVRTARRAPARPHQAARPATTQAKPTGTP